MTANRILDLEMRRNDAGAKTVREYLTALLSALWSEKEGFSGKRPFGNSGWECDLYVALVRGDAISGKIDSDGFAYDYDSDRADRIIAKAIRALSEVPR